MARIRKIWWCWVANPRSEENPYNQDVSEEEVEVLYRTGIYLSCRWILLEKCSRVMELPHSHYFLYDRPGRQCIWLYHRYADQKYDGQHY